MKYALNPLAACMAALFGTASFNVLGAPPAPPPVQNQNATGTQPGTGTPTATVPPVLATRPTPPVFPPMPSEFVGLPWGSFLVFPEVTLAATYDDNIYAERPDGALHSYLSEDVIYTLSPSIALKSKWARHALNFDAGGDFDRYQQHDSENVNDYWLGFDGRYDITPSTNIFGGARHSRDHEDRSTPGSNLSQIKPTLYDHDEAHLGVAHAFGAFRLRAGGTYDRYNYQNGTLASGATVNNDYRDHNLSSLGVRLGYVLSPQYEVFGQVASDTRRYDNLIPGQSFNRDSDGYRAAAGLKFTLRPQRVAGEAFAGVMQQNFDYSGFSDVRKPYFGALVAWKPTSQTTATGFIDRSLEETVVYDGGVYASSSTDTTYGFEVERRLTSKLSANGRAAYTRSEFNDFTRLDKIIDAGAGLRYYVMPTVYLGADLRIIDRASSYLNAQYSRNQVLVSVGYTPARNRDYSIIPEREAGAPEAPRAQGLYSGFYLGAQLGHGGLTTSTFGPRGGGGTDAGEMGGFGASYALFGGWGTELADNWYLGVEVDGGDSNANWKHSKLKDDARTEFLDKDSYYGVSLRAGYLLDGGMLYGKIGKVRTDFHTYYTENQYAPAGASNQDHTETGTRLGLGLEIPASRNLFVRTDYSVTRYGTYGVTYQSGAAPTTVTTEAFRTSDAVFSLGLGWRFGGQRPAVATRPASDHNGLYLGASLGQGTLGTKLTGIQYDSGVGPYSFTGDFANQGFTGGFFAGYGLTFKQVYVGLELEAEAANFGWEHQRAVAGSGGRDFGADKRGGYGGSLRVGYVLPNGSLLYGHVGEVQTRFNTFYSRGAGTPINQSDTLDGTRVGLGAEIPASQNTFVRMDYSYTRYNDSLTVSPTQPNADIMTFDNTETLARLGLGYRF